MLILVPPVSGSDLPTRLCCLLPGSGLACCTSLTLKNAFLQNVWYIQLLKPRKGLSPDRYQALYLLPECSPHDQAPMYPYGCSVGAPEHHSKPNCCPTHASSAVVVSSIGMFDASNFRYIKARGQSTSGIFKLSASMIFRTCFASNKVQDGSSDPLLSSPDPLITVLWYQTFSLLPSQKFSLL